MIIADSRSEDSIKTVSSESDQRKDSPEDGPDVVDKQDGAHFGESQWCTRETFDDDVVTIPRDDGQSEDLTVSEHRS